YTAATTQSYMLSLHDALPISMLPVFGGISGSTRMTCRGAAGSRPRSRRPALGASFMRLSSLFGLAEGLLPVFRFRQPFSRRRQPDRKSTRLNSSHVKISYAVF